jgi:hypothetical protein
MAFNFSPKVVTDGLVFVLDAANSKSYISGSTVYTDLSKNNYTGSLVNGPTFSNSNGGAILFDGIDDVANTQTLNEQFLSTGLTLSIVLNYNQITTNDNVISWGVGAFNAGTSNTWELRIRGGGNVEFANGRIIGAEVAPRRLTYSQSPALNGRIAVIDITYVIDGTASIYENSIKKGTQDYAGSGTSNLTRSIQIGKGTDTYFPGTIYSVKIYNRALSAVEILQNYNAIKGRFGLT